MRPARSRCASQSVFVNNKTIRDAARDCLHKWLLKNMFVFLTASEHNATWKQTASNTIQSRTERKNKLTLQLRMPCRSSTWHIALSIPAHRREHWSDICLLWGSRIINSSAASILSPCIYPIPKRSVLSCLKISAESPNEAVEIATFALSSCFVSAWDNIAVLQHTNVGTGIPSEITA